MGAIQKSAIYGLARPDDHPGFAERWVPGRGCRAAIDGSASAAPGEKAVVFEAGLAIGKRFAIKGLDAAAGGFEDRLAGCGVPFHRRAETRVEVGFAGRDHTKFKGAAAAFARPHWIILQELGESAAVFM